MKRVLSLALVAVACVGFVACQPGAAGLTDQDKAAIRQLDDDWIKAVLSGKPAMEAALDKYYADDAVLMMEHMAAADGRQAIRAALAEFPSLKDFKLTEVSLEGGGGIAYRHYTYVVTSAVPGMPEPMTDRGNGIEVFKKQGDGTWRVIRDIGTSNLPIPGLAVPTGAVAADAGPELKQLGDVVGRWRFDGTMKPNPTTAGGPVDLLFQCDWFAGGKQVVYRFGGTMAGAPYEEIGAYSFDAKAKGYSYYAIVNDGTSAPGVLTVKPGTWIHAYEFQAGGKPVKAHFTMSDMTPAGGAWKYEVSIAGGPWTVMGEGKYTKAN